MDMLKGLASGGDSKKDSDKPESGLVAGAKSVAEAAKSTFSTSTAPDKVDKPKEAGAADNLLETAKGYLKTGEEGVGKMVNQAGEFIHKYTPAAGAEKPAAPPVAKKEESGSGLGGDALKKAGGLFKK